MVQTCNKIMNKALEISRDCFFFPPYTILFFVLSFSYLQRILLLSPFRSKDINVFMCSRQESILVIKGPCFEVV